MAEVLFICDSGAEVGGGHVMRCLTLAGALKRIAIDSAFLAPPAAERVLEAFDDVGVRVVRTIPGDPDHLAVAGMAVLASGAFTALVTDHYGISAEQERRLAAPGRPLLAVDDLADRPRLADLLLDPGLGRRAADYAHLLPQGAEMLLGPRYALVRPEFAARREQALARRRSASKVSRAVISLGLTDVGGVTGRTVEALIDGLGEVCLDVVTGAAAPSLPALRALAQRDARVRLHVETREMASLLAAADIAIGAGGSSTWERACLGVPTITLVLAENQEPLTQALAELRAIVAVDAREPGFQVSLRNRWAELLPDAAARISLSEKLAALCDGRGADRVAERLAARLDG